MFLTGTGCIFFTRAVKKEVRKTRKEKRNMMGNLRISEEILWKYSYEKRNMMGNPKRNIIKDDQQK